MKTNIPVIEDIGSMKNGIWVPDWKAMSEQAKKLGAKTVKTKSGTIINFDNNYNPVNVNDNPQAKYGDWIDKHSDRGSLQEYQENYNQPSVSYPPNFVGMNNNIQGFDYNSAWGGRWENGGTLPGTNGFQYARHGAPSEGKYAKKTLPSAQSGKMMSYYQQGLDFEPKTISAEGATLQLEKLDQLTNFTNYNKPTRGGWLDKYQ